MSPVAITLYGMFGWLGLGLFVGGIVGPMLRNQRRRTTISLDRLEAEIRRLAASRAQMAVYDPIDCSELDCSDHAHGDASLLGRPVP